MINLATPRGAFKFLPRLFCTLFFLSFRLWQTFIHGGELLTLPLKFVSSFCGANKNKSCRQRWRQRRRRRRRQKQALRE